MTDAELIEALRHRLPGEVRATDLVPIVREYAEDFAAIKLHEAADAWDMDDDLMFDSDSLRHRAGVLHTYRSSDRP